MNTFKERLAKMLKGEGFTYAAITKEILPTTDAAILGAAREFAKDDEKSQIECLEGFLKSMGIEEPIKPKIQITGNYQLRKLMEEILLNRSGKSHAVSLSTFNAILAKLNEPPLEILS